MKKVLAAILAATMFFTSFPEAVSAREIINPNTDIPGGAIALMPIVIFDYRMTLGVSALYSFVDFAYSLKDSLSEPLELIEMSNEVICIVNEEREKSDLPPIVNSSALTFAARIRAMELETEPSHYRPDGRGCFSVLSDLKISFLAAGENIGAGQKDAETVMKEWMDSPGHKANILDPNFDEIGVACFRSSSGRLYWTQIFIDSNQT